MQSGDLSPILSQAVVMPDNSPSLSGDHAEADRISKARFRLLTVAHAFHMTPNEVLALPAEEAVHLAASYAAERYFIEFQQRQVEMELINILNEAHEVLGQSSVSAEEFHQAINQLAIATGIASQNIIDSLQTFAQQFWDSYATVARSLNEMLADFAEALQQTDVYVDVLSEQRTNQRSKIRRQADQRRDVQTIRVSAHNRQLQRPLMGNRPHRINRRY